MTSGLVVVGHERIRNPDQVGFVERDHMIQAFPPHRPDDALCEGVLPRRPERGQDLVDAHAADAPCNRFAKDRVVVSDQEPRHRVVWEGIPELSNDPLGRRVRRHFELNDPPPCMVQGHEHIQHAACTGRHRGSDQTSSLKRPPQSRSPLPDSGQKKLNRRPVIPTFFFVLSYSWHRLAVLRLAVRPRKDADVARSRRLRR